VPGALELLTFSNRTYSRLRTVAVLISIINERGQSDDLPVPRGPRRARRTARTGFCPLVT
jgi:hypothetical protein